MYIWNNSGRKVVDRNDGVKMSTLLKWITAALLAGFVWLVALYTDEYLRPYKGIRIRNK